MSDVVPLAVAGACFVVGAACFLNIRTASADRRAEQVAYATVQTASDLQLIALPLGRLLDLKAKLHSFSVRGNGMAAEAEAAGVRVGSAIETKLASRVLVQ